MTPPVISQDDIAMMRKELTALGFSESEIAIEIQKAKGEQPELVLIDKVVPVFDWFCEVDDLFRFENGLCLGLDVPAVLADSQLRQREVKPADYALLRDMSKAAATSLNKQVKQRTASGQSGKTRT